MIKEKLVCLYKDYYGDKFNDIVTGGVVDEKTYVSIYPKIVFLLREPHTEKTGWSMTNGLRRNVEKGLKGEALEKRYMYTWRQAGVWAYAIIYGFDRYQVLRKNSYVAEGIKAIGMTNLKKTGGQATSNRHEIGHHAKQEKQLWQKELEIMSPDLILCGNTFNMVINNIGLERILLAEIGEKRYYYSLCNLNGKKAVVLDFWHPNNRRRRDDNLSDLNILMSKLKEKGFL